MQCFYYGFVKIRKIPYAQVLYKLGLSLGKFRYNIIVMLTFVVKFVSVEYYMDGINCCIQNSS